MIASGYAPNSIRGLGTGDVDFDGDEDVLVAIRSEDKILWLENGGDGSSWTEHVVDTGLDEAYDVIRVDLDEDGDFDLVAGGHASSGTVAWYENDGSESFTRHDIDTGAAVAGVYDVSAGDIDGDGDIDLAAATEGSDDIIW
ncbi:MAG: hypothetical protein MAG453_01619 [Calditrichaeota bacterium]|nr:hypothetical protein [Calditrichota bacterium]